MSVNSNYKISPIFFNLNEGSFTFEDRSEAPFNGETSGQTGRFDKHISPEILSPNE
jgi:hypothetical protein